MKTEGDLFVTEYGMVKTLVEGLREPTKENFIQKLADADLAIELLGRLGEPVHPMIRTRRERAKVAALRAFRDDAGTDEVKEANNAFDTLRTELILVARDTKNILLKKLDRLVADYYLMPHEAEDCKCSLRHIVVQDRPLSGAVPA